MKIDGFTLATNSIVGFRASYFYSKGYDIWDDDEYESKIFITLLYPGYTKELTILFDEEKYLAFLYE